MNKELEYIQRHIDIVKQQIKGSKMKIIVTDAVTKHQYDYYENELQTLESIEKSLNCLEEINNIFEDCTICEIQKEFAKYDKLCEETKCEECALCVGNEICLRRTFERKWELQKEIASPNSVNLLMRELDCKCFAELRKYARCGYEKINKKYLKWEDLEFNRKEAEYMKVSLNGTKYCLVLTWGFCEPKLVKVKPINLYEGKETDGQTIFLLDGNYIDDVQFFNDLHLERVEE